MPTHLLKQCLPLSAKVLILPLPVTSLFCNLQNLYLQKNPKHSPPRPKQIQYYNVIHCKDNTKQYWVFTSSLYCTFLMNWINYPYCFTMSTTKSTCLLLQCYLVMDYLIIYFSSLCIFHSVNRIMEIISAGLLALSISGL